MTGGVLRLSPVPMILEWNSQLVNDGADMRKSRNLKLPDCFWECVLA